MARPLELAVRIGERLCAEAIWDEERATWLGDERVPLGEGWEIVHTSMEGDLYGGTAGIGLFLARLWTRTREEALRRAAEGALAHAHRWARHGRRGGSLYSGLAGVAAVTAEAAERFASDTLLKRARRLAGDTLECLPTGSADLLSGAAGSIVALLELARRLAMPEAAEAASRLGEGLLRRAVGEPYPGLAWAAEDDGGPPLCGLGHGASGVAFALAELWLHGGDARFLDATRRAVEYERAWYQRERLNWPDLRQLDRATLAAGGSPSFPAFWCHGAIGIGLVRLRLYELTGEGVFAAEAEAALERAEKGLAELAEGQARADLSLCHGLAAYAELLVSGGGVFEDASLQDRAVECARLAAELAADGDGPWPSGVHDGGENPSLMLGLAGTGMMFLRVADPATPPAGLLFAPRVMRERVIVQLGSEVQAADYAATAARLLELAAGARVERISPRGRVLLRLPAGTAASEVATRLQALESVEYAEPDRLDHEAASDAAPDAS